MTLESPGFIRGEYVNMAINFEEVQAGAAEVVDYAKVTGVFSQAFLPGMV